MKLTVERDAYRYNYDVPRGMRVGTVLDHAWELLHFNPHAEHPILLNGVRAGQESQIRHTGHLRILGSAKAHRRALLRRGEIALPFYVEPRDTVEQAFEHAWGALRLHRYGEHEVFLDGRPATFKARIGAGSVVDFAPVHGSRAEAHFRAGAARLGARFRGMIERTVAKHYRGDRSVRQILRELEIEVSPVQENVAGYASTERNHIIYNHELWKMGPRRYRRVVLHEFVHLVLVARSRNASHDEEFVQEMGRLGFRGLVVAHDMIHPFQYSYACEDCGLQVTAAEHMGCSSCLECGGPMTAMRIRYRPDDPLNRFGRR